MENVINGGSDVKYSSIIVGGNEYSVGNEIPYDLRDRYLKLNNIKIKDDITTIKNILGVLDIKTKLKFNMDNDIPDTDYCKFLDEACNYIKDYLKYPIKNYIKNNIHNLKCNLNMLLIDICNKLLKKYYDKYDTSIIVSINLKKMISKTNYEDKFITRVYTSESDKIPQNIYDLIKILMERTNINPKITLKENKYPDFDNDFKLTLNDNVEKSEDIKKIIKQILDFYGNNISLLNNIEKYYTIECENLSRILENI